MRILLASRFYLNGQTTHVLNLAKELKSLGHSVFLVLSYMNHSPTIEYLQKERIPFSANPNLERALVKGPPFDSIHTHSCHTILQALTLGSSHKLPVVASCHYLSFEPVNLLKKATQVVLISPEMKREMNLEQALVVENGVVIPKQKSLQKRKSKLLVVIGQMTKGKLPALINLKHAVESWGGQLVFIGSSHVRLPIPHLPWQVDLSDVFLKQPYIVGTGRTIREGMAHGCTCIVLGETLDGILTPHTVEAFRRCNFSGRANNEEPSRENLLKLLTTLDSLSIEELGTFGQKYAREHFCSKVMAREIEKIYQRLAPLRES